MGATRDVALTDLPIRGISINSAADGAAAVTIVPSDSGVIFVNRYAATTTYTLPAVADTKGKWFWFYSDVAQTLVVTGPTGSLDVMTGGTTSAAVDADLVTLTAVIGGWGMVTSDGTNYFFFLIAGSWTGT